MTETSLPFTDAHQAPSMCRSNDAGARTLLDAPCRNPFGSRFGGRLVGGPSEPSGLGAASRASARRPLPPRRVPEWHLWSSHARDLRALSDARPPPVSTYCLRPRVRLDTTDFRAPA